MKKTVVIAGVVASVICGVFGLDPKIIGLIVSMCVAYVALYLAEKRRTADYVVTGFNGFLIYFTLVGAICIVLSKRGLGLRPEKPLSSATPI